MKRWEGRGAPPRAKLMRFHIVLINSRCGADTPPTPPDDCLLGLVFGCSTACFCSGLTEAAPRGPDVGGPGGLTQVKPPSASLRTEDRGPRRLAQARVKGRPTRTPALWWSIIGSCLLFLKSGHFLWHVNKGQEFRELFLLKRSVDRYI